MKNNNAVLFLIIALVTIFGLLGLGVYLDSQSNEQETESDSTSQAQNQESDMTTSDRETENDDESNSSFDDEQTDEMNESVSGEYIEYNESSLSDEGTNVLFFAASWCPTCNALDRDITQNENEIPSNVTIHKVDYDSARNLRRTYGVTTQHTLVEVDGNGDEIQKWIGGNTLTTIVNKI